MHQVTSVTPSVRMLALNLATAGKRMDLYQFAALLGYSADHVDQITRGATPDKEKLMLAWHNWELLCQAFKRVDTELLERVISYYG